MVERSDDTMLQQQQQQQQTAAIPGQPFIFKETQLLPYNPFCDTIEAKMKLVPFQKTKTEKKEKGGGGDG